MLLLVGRTKPLRYQKDIKAWYGSHTSGTYGELGYAVDGSQLQTLIVPDGCNLTLVNMKVFSSVNIVVENGGKLVLRDSSIHGNIEVKNGGSSHQTMMIMAVSFSQVLQLMDS